MERSAGRLTQSPHRSCARHSTRDQCGRRTWVRISQLSRICILGPLTRLLGWAFHGQVTTSAVLSSTEWAQDGEKIRLPACICHT